MPFQRRSSITVISGSAPTRTGGPKNQRAMAALGCPHEAAEHHRETLRTARGIPFHRAEQHAPAGLRTPVFVPCRV
ncbi:hypothetical protein ABZT02_15620 [Streptomyces sp. NPDC005402]|uniref:hypothetical protein n=1 Tax=Streptomyces sp. NPDC005402 TaxID=3155338 RepID=UPI0033A8A4F8